MAQGAGKTSASAGSGAKPTEPAEKTKKLRPTKVIPTERLTVKRQLDILRAFTAASGPSNKAVTNKEVSDILKMADTTVSLANYFFIETGLLNKSAAGFVPSSEVISYTRAYEWNPETAAHKLAPALSKTWFADALTPKLSFRQMEEDEAINTLADISAAAPDYKPNLRMLIEFLEASGIVQRDGTIIRLARSNPSGDGVTRDTPQEKDAPQSSPAPRATVSTTFSQPTEGVVQFHVSVKVEMAEFASWHPERISAFFNGIAQVLAAKAAIEKQISE